jgi:hypothetical protein
MRENQSEKVIVHLLQLQAIGILPENEIID